MEIRNCTECGGGVEVTENAPTETCPECGGELESDTAEYVHVGTMPFEYTCLNCGKSCLEHDHELIERYHCYHCGKALLVNKETVERLGEALDVPPKEVGGAVIDRLTGQLGDESVEEAISVLAYNRGSIETLIRVLADEYETQQSELQQLLGVETSVVSD